MTMLPDKMEEKKDPNPKPDVKKLVEADRQERVTACEAEIQEVLKKHNCNLSTLQEWVNGQPGKVLIKVVSSV